MDDPLPQRQRMGLFAAEHDDHDNDDDGEPPPRVASSSTFSRNQANLDQLLSSLGLLSAIAVSGRTAPLLLAHDLLPRI
jgi:hypothetical protein